MLAALLRQRLSDPRRPRLEVTNERAYLEGQDYIGSNAQVLGADCFLCVLPPSRQSCVIGAGYLIPCVPFPYPCKRDNNDANVRFTSPRCGCHLAPTWMLR